MLSHLAQLVAVFPEAFALQYVSARRGSASTAGLGLLVGPQTPPGNKWELRIELQPLPNAADSAADAEQGRVAARSLHHVLRSGDACGTLKWAKNWGSFHASANEVIVRSLNFPEAPSFVAASSLCPLPVRVADLPSLLGPAAGSPAGRPVPASQEREHSRWRLQGFRERLWRAAEGHHRRFLEDRGWPDHPAWHPAFDLNNVRTPAAQDGERTLQLASSVWRLGIKMTARLNAWLFLAADSAWRPP